MIEQQEITTARDNKKSSEIRCKAMLCCVIGWFASGQGLAAAESSAKRYEATWESSKTHPVPQWFDDAKFGIFIHWRPYSVLGYRKGGTGYAEHVPKEIYRDTAHYYPYLKKRFGAAPPEFGYKDVIPMWSLVANGVKIVPPKKWTGEHAWTFKIKRAPARHSRDFFMALEGNIPHFSPHRPLLMRFRRLALFLLILIMSAPRPVAAFATPYPSSAKKPVREVFHGTAVSTLLTQHPDLARAGVAHLVLAFLFEQLAMRPMRPN